MKKFLLPLFFLVSLATYAQNDSLYSLYSLRLHQLADAGDTESQFHLGKCYADGLGIQKDYEKAAYWYTRAAKKGYYKAQNNLGLLYWKGEGVEKSNQEALYWLMLAANQGHSKPKANIGMVYIYGDDVRNYQEALKWLHLAAEQDDAFAQYYMESAT